MIRTDEISRDQLAILKVDTMKTLIAFSTVSFLVLAIDLPAFAKGKPNGENGGGGRRLLFTIGSKCSTQIALTNWLEMAWGCTPIPGTPGVTKTSLPSSRKTGASRREASVLLRTTQETLSHATSSLIYRACASPACNPPFLRQTQPLIIDNGESIALRTINAGESRDVSIVAHYPIAGSNTGEELYLIFGSATDTPIGDVSALCGGASDPITVAAFDTTGTGWADTLNLVSEPYDSVCGITSIDSGRGKNRIRTNSYIGHYHVPFSMEVTSGLEQPSSTASVPEPSSITPVVLAMLVASRRCRRSRRI